MTRVTLDGASLARLRENGPQVAVCDESGRLVGFFSLAPADDRADYENVAVPLTQEELDRSFSTPGGRSLDAILADLEKQS
jgi:hypothetical protein